MDLGCTPQLVTAEERKPPARGRTRHLDIRENDQYFIRVDLDLKSAELTVGGLRAEPSLGVPRARAPALWIGRRYGAC